MEVVTSKSAHSGINEALAASGRSASVGHPIKKPEKVNSRLASLASQSAKSTKGALDCKHMAGAGGKFDPEYHRPPGVDTFGYNKETHKGRELMNKNIKNVLSLGDKIHIPEWWNGKRIPGGRFGNVSLSAAHETLSPPATQDKMGVSRS